MLQTGFGHCLCFNHSHRHVVFRSSTNLVMKYENARIVQQLKLLIKPNKINGPKKSEDRFSKNII